MEIRDGNYVGFSTKTITMRFGHWSGPFGVEREFFSRLISETSGCSVEIKSDEYGGPVDVNIESVYGASSVPDLQSRMYRFIHSKMPGGIPFDGGRHTPNQQPSIRSKLNIFFTAENERPPEGKWDLYFSFDVHSFRNRNHYLPLWWITTTDLLFPKVSPWLGKPVTINELMNPRATSFQNRKKFCVAFIGKAYPFRMHSLSALSQIGKVDVYGEIARNSKRSGAVNKYEIAQEYRFFYAFENDLYPGYVTEKAPEAWATGAVPLYWGLDVTNSLNSKAMINLADFGSLDDFIENVREINDSEEKWTRIASQPLLIKEPSLDQIKSALRRELLEKGVI